MVGKNDSQVEVTEFIVWRLPGLGGWNNIKHGLELQAKSLHVSTYVARMIPP